ncbi:MAG: serine kinase [Variibacter sp.]|nr:serine kinase [Variibacter sp.]
MGTIHASAVLVGERAVLIRGASGSGKSRLVLALLQAAGSPSVPFARLVADDRVLISVAHGRLLAAAPKALAGLLEIRGLGIRRAPCEPAAVVGFVVDLAADRAGGERKRLPDPPDLQVTLEGVTLPRVEIPSCADPLPVLLAALGAAKAQGGSDSLL